MNHNLAEKGVAPIANHSDEAERVRRALLAHGLETPLLPHQHDRDEKYERIKRAFTEVAKTLGLDLGDDSLSETPHRIAKMYVDEIFAGLDYRNFPRISVIENKMGTDEMVRVSDIGLTSTCEHHFVTIDGTARVAYIPGERIIGLSKINRIVRFFAVMDTNSRTQTTALGGLFKSSHKTRAEFLA